MSTKLTGYVWDGCAASGMKLSSVAIMARLADFSNDEGVCWPSIETIARQIGAGMSTVRTAIARLEAEGWLTRKARRQGNRNASNVYQLNVAKLQAAAFLNCQILTRQNLTHQNLTRQNLMRRNLVKKRVFTRQNLAGIRQ
ncbi:phage O protein family [Escherichia coli]|nr:phage O protein family [Escherichia coli]